MKNILLLLLTAMSFTAFAQIPFKVCDSIKVNNINALCVVHGDMWYNPHGGTLRCKFFNEGRYWDIAKTGGIWLSGYGLSGKAYVSAQSLRGDGIDFWPGPLNSMGATDYATSAKWAKIWKVTKVEISEYMNITYHTTANTPESILTWPAKGNAYARGMDGAVLEIDRDMAPFVDQNGDGVYQPLKGDYPAVKGEQTLWWLLNDNGPTHNQTDGEPLKVEIQVMAYAYKRGTLIDNVLYYDYTLVNRSGNDYLDFRFGFWGDMDLGYYMDDHIGFDSVYRMGITYNAVIRDGAPGSPWWSLLPKPHITGVTFVAMPGDNSDSYVPAGSFMYFSNDPSVLGYPRSDTEYNYYMRSRWRNGTHLKNTFVGAGIPNTGYMYGPDCKYVFDGDPADSMGWSECNSGNVGSNKYIVLASNDFELNRNQTQKIVLALVVDPNGGGCPEASFAGIKEVADTAWHNYYNPPVSVDQTAMPQHGVKVYPNPAHNKLMVKNETATDMHITICNMLGQVMCVYEGIHGAEQAIDIAAFALGVYVVRCVSSQGVVSKVKFVKE